MPSSRCRPLPERIPAFRPPRVRSRPREEGRPNAYQRGYCDKTHRAWRLAVLTRDAWTCRQCGRVCSDHREAHADHVSPVVSGTDACADGRSRYDVDAGQCLCSACHQRKTNAEARGVRA
ncbi:MAG: hypothetical protein EBZ91_13525, partial [Gammaproteobacteria bacterium]|nr:hypothetical protein [Gammaproteobacteria bacterium]